MKKSIMDIAKKEERKEFLKLSPLVRMETMHDFFLQIVVLKAKRSQSMKSIRATLEIIRDITSALPESAL